MSGVTGADRRERAPVGFATRLFQQSARYRNIVALLVLLIVFFSVTQHDFFTGANLSNLLTAVSVLWVVAIGETFVLISGGVDLSVGALGALVGIIVAKLLLLGIPSGFVVVIAIMLGTLIGGVINGTLIGKFGLSFFIVTLASYIAFTGVVNVWSQTQSFIISAPAIIAIGTHNMIGIPICVWIMALVFVVALFLQRRTYFGRSVYAIGGSVVAARLSGIRPARILLLVYSLCACLAALGGVISTGRIGAASPQVDTSLPLDAAAAVLIGGTSLTGGAGGVEGTAFGVLFIGVLQNGLSLAGVQSFWQEVVTGVILIAAVFSNTDTAAALFSRLRRGVSRSGRPAAAA